MAKAGHGRVRSFLHLDIEFSDYENELRNYYRSQRSDLTPGCHPPECIGSLELFETEFNGYGLRIMELAEPGDILLVSKAVATCVREYEVHRSDPESSKAEKGKETAEPVAKGSTSSLLSRQCPREVSEKLHDETRKRITNFRRAFQILTLDCGICRKASVPPRELQYYVQSETIEEDSVPVNVAEIFQEDNFLRDVISRNAFSDDATWAAEREPGGPVEAHKAEFWGLWLLPAFINHSCAPNCSRQRIGDLLIVRATKRLQPNDELTLPYFDVYKPVSVREESSKLWGFVCRCPRCTFERSKDSPRIEDIRERYLSIDQRLNAISHDDVISKSLATQLLEGMMNLNTQIDEELYHVLNGVPTTERPHRSDKAKTSEESHRESSKQLGLTFSEDTQQQTASSSKQATTPQSAESSMGTSMGDDREHQHHLHPVLGHQVDDQPESKCTNPTVETGEASMDDKESPNLLATPSPASVAKPSPNSSPSLFATPSPSLFATPSPSLFATPSPSPFATPRPSPFATPSPSLFATLSPSTHATPTPTPMPSLYATPSSNPGLDSNIPLDPISFPNLSPNPTPAPNPNPSPSPNPVSDPHSTPIPIPSPSPSPGPIPTPQQSPRPNPPTSSIPTPRPSTGPNPKPRPRRRRSTTTGVLPQADETPIPTVQQGERSISQPETLLDLPVAAIAENLRPLGLHQDLSEDAIRSHWIRASYIDSTLASYALSTDEATDAPTLERRFEAILRGQNLLLQMIRTIWTTTGWHELADEFFLRMEGNFEEVLRMRPNLPRAALRTVKIKTMVNLANRLLQEMGRGHFGSTSSEMMVLPVTAIPTSLR